MAAEIQAKRFGGIPDAAAEDRRWYATEGLAIALMGAGTIAAVFLGLGAPVWMALVFAAASIAPLARTNRGGGSPNDPAA